MICLPQCADNTNKPTVGYSNTCETRRAPGGIPRLLFLICDPDYVHPYPVPYGKTSYWEDLRNVKAAMCAGILNVSAPLLGQVAKPSPTKKQFDSCAPEEKSGGTTSITFQDYYTAIDTNSDPTLVEFDFWIWAQNNVKTLSLGWITCDDMLFLWDGKFSLYVGVVAEQSNTGNRYFDGEAVIPTADIIKPYYVPGLLSEIESFDATASCS